ncbi:integrin beta-2-like [Thomomys bottae]
MSGPQASLAAGPSLHSTPPHPLCTSVPSPEHTEPPLTLGPDSTQATPCHCAECLKFATGAYKKNCSAACGQVRMRDSPMKGKQCKEQGSHNCWISYTLRQRDGLDSYDVYVEDDRECVPSRASTIGGGRWWASSLLLVVIWLVLTLCKMREA